MVHAAYPRAMLPDGPTTPKPLLTLRYMRDPDAVVAENRARYGDVFRIRTLNVSGVMVCSAELAKEAFARDPEEYDAFAAPLGPILGDRSIFATSGSVHRSQRRLLNGRFHGSQLKRFLETMHAIVQDRVAAWRPRDLKIMLEVGQDIALDVILATVFGDGDLDLAPMRGTLLGMLERFSPALVFSPHVRSPLFPPWRAFVEARAAFVAFVERATATRRERGIVGQDILGMFLDARYDDGAPMSPDEIVSHLLTLVVAGHETTAISIAWAAMHLAREPRALAALRAELDHAPDAADVLVKLPYLTAFCDETLRLHPPVTDVVRPVRVETPVGGFTVPPGEAICVAINAITSDPTLYPEPKQFRPERFLERKYAGAEHPVFGGGHRHCLGRTFAEFELRLVVAAIARRWDLSSTADGNERTVRRNVTMAPVSGIPVRVRPRAVTSPRPRAPASDR